MKEALILKGIPACGKSTIAKQLEAKGWVRINRDTIRKENPDKTEQEVRHIKNLMITDADAAGLNIVIDDTNIIVNTLHKTMVFLESLGYKVTIEDVFDDMAKENFGMYRPPYLHKYALDECIKRNALREQRVPESVIYEMYLQDGYALGLPNMDVQKENAIIVDLDGTLYNMEHRLHHVQHEDKKLNRWDKFESSEEVRKDTVYEQVKNTINMLGRNYIIILVSGRKNTVCEQTVKNLERDGIIYDGLLMRQARDGRPDDQVKQDFLDLLLRKHKIFAAFDDRKKVIDMWKKNGIYVFNCCQRDSNDF